MLKLILKLFGNQLHDHFLRAFLSVTVENLDEIDKKYLSKLHKEGQLHEILQKIKFAIVKTGMAANTKEQIQQRRDWIQFCDYLSDLMRSEAKIDSTGKINALTQLPYEVEKK